MQKRNIKWIGFKSLIKELELDEIEIFQLIEQNKLSAYRLISKTEYLEDIRVIPQPIQEWGIEADHKPAQLVFDREEVELLKAADEKGTAPIPALIKNQYEPAGKISKLYFHALSIETLQLIARRWAETFYSKVPIVKIVLYPYGSKFAGVLAEIQRGSNRSKKHQLPKYAIVFEIDAEDETLKMSTEELHDYHKKRVRGLIPPQPWDKLLRDIHFYDTVSEGSYPQLLQPGFCNAYKTMPNEMPYWEWYIGVKFRNTMVQDSVRREPWEPCIVLYSYDAKITLESDTALMGGHFIELNLDILKGIAFTNWASRYCTNSEDGQKKQFLKQIALYNFYSSEFSEKKYAIIFEAGALNTESAKHCFERLRAECNGDFEVDQVPSFNQVYRMPRANAREFIFIAAHSGWNSHTDFPGVLQGTGFVLWTAEEKPIVKNKSIDELAIEYGTAAERLYLCMYERLKRENKTLSNAVKADLYDAAQKEFNDSPDYFLPLTKAHIEGDAIYNSDEKQRRRVVGMIISAALGHHPGAEQNYQKTYERFLELKKTFKKAP